MQAPKTIIQNRGDTFNPTFVDLLAGLVVVTKPPRVTGGQPAATP